MLFTILIEDLEIEYILCVKTSETRILLKGSINSQF